MEDIDCRSMWVNPSVLWYETDSERNYVIFEPPAHQMEEKQTRFVSKLHQLRYSLCITPPGPFFCRLKIQLIKPSQNHKLFEGESFSMAARSSVMCKGLKKRKMSRRLSLECRIFRNSTSILSSLSHLAPVTAFLKRRVYFPLLKKLPSIT